MLCCARAARSTIFYHGPLEGAVPFLESQGFVCPPRKDTSVFLTEVTTAAGRPDTCSCTLGPLHQLPSTPPALPIDCKTSQLEGTNSQPFCLQGRWACRS
jgi:hypothetical protein